MNYLIKIYLIFVILLFSVFSGLAKTQKVSYPDFETKTIQNIVLKSVIFDSDKTILGFSCINKSGDNLISSFNIQPTSYLIASGNKYPIQKAVGVDLFPQSTKFSNENSSIDFELHFKKIPANTILFDFIDSLESPYNIYGIKTKSGSAKSKIELIVSEVEKAFNSKKYSAAYKSLSEISNDKLVFESDSIKFCVYYHQYQLDSVFNKSSIERITHLKSACMSIEHEVTRCKMVEEYLSCIQLLGNEFMIDNKIEDAIAVYEHALVLLFQYYNNLNEDEQIKYQIIQNSLGSLFERKGLTQLSTQLKTTSPNKKPLTFDYSTNLIEEAFQLISTGKNNEALENLRQAEDILPQTNTPDYDLMYQPLYNAYCLAYASLSDIDKLQLSLKRLKKECKKNDAIRDYHSCLFACVASLWNNDNLEGVNSILETAKLDYESMCDSNKVKVDKYLKYNNTLVETNNKIRNLRDSLTRFNECEDVFISITKQLSDLYISISKYEEALDFSIKNLECCINKKIEDQRYEDALATSVLLINFTKSYKKYGNYITLKVDFTKSKYGDNTIEYASALNELSMMYINIEKYKKGESILISAMNIYLAKLGDECEPMTYIYHNLGRTKMLLNQKDEAIKYLNMAKNLQIKLQGEPNSRTVKYLNEISK